LVLQKVFACSVKLSFPTEQLMVEGTNPYDAHTTATPSTNGVQHQQAAQPAKTEVGLEMAQMSAPSNTTAPVVQEEQQPVENFEDLNLSEDILRGVYSLDFTKPSKVQQMAVLPHIKGRDVLVQSQSGTGKTLAFVLGAVMSVNPTVNLPQVIVWCPTRELTLQTGEVFRQITKFSKIKTVELYGGVRSELIGLNEAHVVVGTTGKIKAQLRRRGLYSSQIRQLIVDEADKMLDGDFVEDVGEICHLLECKQNLQVCFYSATIPEATVMRVKDILRAGYYELLLEQSDVTLDGIKQYHLLCDDDNFKCNALVSLLGDLEVNTIVIFANFKDKVAQLCQFCDEQQIPYVSIMGSMEQEERVKNMHIFRSGQKRFLIATDLVGRGMDVQHVSLVINFQMPLNREDYIHRIGRSGRYGKKGVAINLVNVEELRTLKSFEEHYKFTCKQLPQDVSSLFE